MVIVNSPSNPTGAVYTPQALRDISDLCVGRGVYLLSDEIYEKIIVPWQSSSSRPRRSAPTPRG